MQYRNKAVRVPKVKKETNQKVKEVCGVQCSPIVKRGASREVTLEKNGVRKISRS